MAGSAVRISILADSKEFEQNIGRAQKDLDGLGDSAKRAASDSDRSFGQMAESADKTGGNFAKLGGAVGDIAGGLGLIGLSGFSDQLNAVAPALMLVAGAADVFTVASDALNLSLLANPLTWVVVGLVALAAAFAIVYTKSETFRRVVNGALSTMRDIAVGTFDWFKGHWPLLLGILTGPFGLATLAIVKNWDKIVGFVTGLPGRIGRAAHGMWDGIKDAFRSAINWIIDGWNKLHFTMPSINTHIPGVGTIGGFDVGLPQLPRLAAGGITNGPTLALIGDNPGGREMVRPLDQVQAQESRVVGLLEQIRTSLGRQGRLPDRMTLVVGDRQFTAYVREHAADVAKDLIDTVRDSDARARAMSWSR